MAFSPYNMRKWEYFMFLIKLRRIEDIFYTF